MKIHNTPFYQSLSSWLTVKHYLLILGVVFLLMQVLLYQKFGVKIMHDSTRYIKFAEQMQQGIWPDGYVNWYLGYCAIILLGNVIGIGYGAIIILQVVVALLSLFCLFWLVYTVNGSMGKAFLISLLYAISYQVHLWNVYILTESLFISGTIIITYLLYKVRENERWLFLLLPLLFFTVLQRPNGFILIGSLILYFIVLTWNTNKTFSRSLLGFMLLAALAGLIFLNSNISVFVTFFKTSYLAGEVICGYNGLTLMPANRLMFDENNHSLKVVYELISSDVLYFFRLALSKLFFLFADIRPYYSISHNLYIAGFLSIVYVLFFINVWAFIKKQPALFSFLGSFILLNACLIMITYTDWDGRFLAPLLGPLLIMGGGAKKESINY